MTEEDDFLSEWYRVDQAVDEAKIAVLKSLGYTKSSFYELQQRAIDQATAEITVTQFGPVQRIATPYYIEKNPVKAGERYRLKRITDTSTHQQGVPNG